MKICGKTTDGKRLNEVVSALMTIPGVSLKEGSSHTLLAKYNGPAVYGNPGLCAIGRSTSFDHHIIPWAKKVTGLDRAQLAVAFRAGSFDAIDDAVAQEQHYGGVGYGRKQEYATGYGGMRRAVAVA